MGIWKKKEESKALDEKAIPEPIIAEKSLGNTDINGTSVNVPDVVVFGDGDAWRLICKASSQREGWMKSTKAMEIGTDVLVQVTTQQRNRDGSYALAEALQLVERAFIEDIVVDGKVIGRNILPLPIEVDEPVVEQALAESMAIGKPAKTKA